NFETRDARLEISLKGAHALLKCCDLLHFRALMSAQPCDRRLKRYPEFSGDYTYPIRSRHRSLIRPYGSAEIVSHPSDMMHRKPPQIRPAPLPALMIWR